MDSFEAIVASILQRQGYWVQTGVKVELSKTEKREIGRPSSPRWEIDVVAYSGRGNELLVVECKSLLDSQGVDCRAFCGTNKKAERRYKLFCEGTLRGIVLNRLKEQLVSGGFCAPEPTITICLAAGKIRGNEAQLMEQFEEKGWRLYGPSYIRDQLANLQSCGYQNDVAAVVAKMLLRKPIS